MFFEIILPHFTLWYHASELWAQNVFVEFLCSQMNSGSCQFLFLQICAIRAKLNSVSSHYPQSLCLLTHLTCNVLSLLELSSLNVLGQLDLHPLLLHYWLSCLS